MQQAITYSEREQTPAQRRALIDAGLAWNVAQGAKSDPGAEAIFDRYVAGELTLDGVTAELVKHYSQPATAEPTAPTPPRQSQMQPERLEIA